MCFILNQSGGWSFDGWSVGRSVGQSNGRSVGWSVGRLDGRAIGHPVFLAIFKVILWERVFFFCANLELMETKNEEDRPHSAGIFFHHSLLFIIYFM